LFFFRSLALTVARFSLRLFFGAVLVCSSSVTHAAVGDEAESLYLKNCAVCHGNEGDGRGRAGVNLQPPATSFVGYGQAREAMIAAVADGKVGTAMVGYGRKFDPAEIASVVDFIRTRFMAVPVAVQKSIPDTTSLGHDLYTAHCAVCHGDKGNTAVWARNGLQPPPRDFTAPAAKQDLSLERMLTSVTYGRPGTAMMPFQGRLNEAQILAVVAYVRSAFIEIESEGVAPAVKSDLPTPNSRPNERAIQAHPVIPKFELNAPMPNGLIGNAAQGRDFFMHNCSTCHGKNGDGKGPRAYFNRPPPRNFTSDESRQRFNRPQLFASISHGKPGSVMPAWATVLSQQQIADVGEFVFQTFILNQPSPNLPKSAEKKSAKLTQSGPVAR